MPNGAVVRFPDAPLTEFLIKNALTALDDTVTVANTFKSVSTATRLLQWSTYDLLDHERTLNEPKSILSSAYTIRKALIRKHYLHHTLSSYLAKQPSSILATVVPRTWCLDIAWADELDDLFADELWDLAKSLDEATDNPKWYILKAGMADRGNGIRLFESKGALRAIFEEFDEQCDEDPEGLKQQEIVTSQLRHFVIQEYLSRPLLVNPAHSPICDELVVTSSEPSFKFHLRAYCIASGALTLYLWPHILALFASMPYTSPFRNESGDIDLTSHLTNTSLRADVDEASVRLLSELDGLPILSAPGGTLLSKTDIAEITDKTAEVLTETFRAALTSTINFQPLPNAFELFGTDLLVTHAANGFRVHLLEVNAEPAIELTGQRLRWVLEDMFNAIAKVCVGPFLGTDGCQWAGWKVGEEREGLRKCLEVQVRGAGGW